MDRRVFVDVRYDAESEEVSLWYGEYSNRLGRLLTYPDGEVRFDSYLPSVDWPSFDAKSVDAALLRIARRELNQRYK